MGGCRSAAGGRSVGGGAPAEGRCGPHAAGFEVDSSRGGERLGGDEMLGDGATAAGGGGDGERRREVAATAPSGGGGRTGEEP